MSPRMPTFFISHGGGPWPWLPDMRQKFVDLEASLVAMRRELPNVPRAVLMISGHRESAEHAVMASSAPPMIHDYYGFPPETCEIDYPAPGAPEIAQRTAELIETAGLPVRMDSAHGFDHGTFAPMAVIWPEAKMPVFQVSIRHGYDPAEHMALGRAPAPLCDEGVLIVGSGLSYHNLRRFGPAAAEPLAGFDRWLDQALSLSRAERTDAILNWQAAPHARICHPQEDHPVPLSPALGATEADPATRVYHEVGLFGGVTASGCRFGEAPRQVGNRPAPFLLPEILRGLGQRPNCPSQ